MPGAPTPSSLVTNTVIVAGFLALAADAGVAVASDPAASAVRTSADSGADRKRRMEIPLELKGQPTGSGGVQGRGHLADALEVGGERLAAVAVDRYELVDEPVEHRSQLHHLVALG